MAFVDNLRRLRLERFLSQGELARRAGLHPVTLTRLEAGPTAPSTRSVRSLAAALGVEPRDLATPDEVAQLRRFFRDAARTDPNAGGPPNQASTCADDRR
jgi:transcriptional regulator with XRE-family HTH domain